MSDLLKKSEKLLISFLQEPGGFSFFPPSNLWNEDAGVGLEGIFGSFFSDEKEKDDKLGLYIHIPFCNRICSYCNCFKTINQKGSIDEYLYYIKKEAELLVKRNNNDKIKIDSIFIGGGTPNILDEKQFDFLKDIVDRYFDIDDVSDFLIDCHPAFLDEGKINQYAKHGVTRITFAVQSTDESVLKSNNRSIYDLPKLIDDITYAKHAGLKINIDLMVGIKGQDFGKIKHDLDLFSGNPGVDNISVHYFAKSNNISNDYELPKKIYLELVEKVKSYILSIRLASDSQNIQESDYTSKRGSIISLGAFAVTNIFGGIIYSKPGLEEYKNLIDEGKLPFSRGFLMSRRMEMIKFLYLNIIEGIKFSEFKDIFGEDLIDVFDKELGILMKKGIVRSNKSGLEKATDDLTVFLLFNIIFLFPIIEYVYENQDDSIADSLKLFFDSERNLIDR